VGSGHPLLGAAAQAAIERAASAHRGRRWVSQGFTSLDDRASHPCGILHGAPFSVFAKLSPAADAREQFTAELAGLRLALVDYFQPVPDELFREYRDIAPVDRGFAGRRELWRLPAYLAIVAVDGEGLFGRRYLDRLAAAVRSYR
jgi:fructosamine-3-kinase